MRLLDLVRRSPRPEPWAEGDNIPWHEPGFSSRMLREHLSQAHDAASRRSEKIDRQVAWIHGGLLNETPSRVLDLGCGPGLYAARLAALGHRCRGIDFSPASIRYARERAATDGSACVYVEGDLRQADFGRDHDLAMLLYGELNVFAPDDALRRRRGDGRGGTPRPDVPGVRRRRLPSAVGERRFRPRALPRVVDGAGRGGGGRVVRGHGAGRGGRRGLRTSRKVVAGISTWPCESETIRCFASTLVVPIALWLITRLLGRLV